MEKCSHSTIKVTALESCVNTGDAVPVQHCPLMNSSRYACSFDPFILVSSQIFDRISHKRNRALGSLEEWKRLKRPAEMRSCRRVFAGVSAGALTQQAPWSLTLNLGTKRENSWCQLLSVDAGEMIRNGPQMLSLCAGTAKRIHGQPPQ